MSLQGVGLPRGFFDRLRMSGGKRLGFFDELRMSGDEGFAMTDWISSFEEVRLYGKDNC